MTKRYIDAMSEHSDDPKVQLWKAVHNGDYKKFKELIDAKTLKDINEYKYGITLLHALVYRDGSSDAGAWGENVNEITENRKKIAQSLLDLGADLHAPAKEGAPWGIHEGHTPLIMAKRFTPVPFYYHLFGHSLVYTGENVLPVFERHLGIRAETPSMFTQFRNGCIKNALPIAAIVTAALSAAVISQAKFSPKP